MPRQKLRIESSAIPNDAQILLDGKELTGVKSIMIEMAVGEINRAYIEFVGMELEFEADVELDEEEYNALYDSLIAKDWTGPTFDYDKDTIKMPLFTSTVTKRYSAFAARDGADFFNDVAEMVNATP